MKAKNENRKDTGGEHSRHSTGARVAAAAAGVAVAAAAGVAIAKVARRGRATILHVTPLDERWEIRADGDKTPSQTFDTKEEAVAFARGLAHRRVPAELVIHRADGTEQDRHSYA